VSADEIHVLIKINIFGINGPKL